MCDLSAGPERDPVALEELQLAGWRLTHPGNGCSLVDDLSNSWMAVKEAQLRVGSPFPCCPSSGEHLSCSGHYDSRRENLITLHTADEECKCSRLTTGLGYPVTRPLCSFWVSSARTITKMVIKMRFCCNPCTCASLLSLMCVCQKKTTPKGTLNYYYTTALIYLRVYV